MAFERLHPKLVVTGEPGAACTIQYTAELRSDAEWRTLTELVLEEGAGAYIDQETLDDGVRFYRVMVADGPAPNLQAEGVWIGPTGIPNPNPERLAWIPPGTFMMGSPPSEAGRNPDEGPPTLVTISRGFWLGKHEVTQGEYVSVMGDNPSRFKGDSDRPVDQVSWHDAVAYCEALTESERSAGRLPAGHEYRLPTEAQWEYACRAGTATRFSFGDALGCSDQCGYCLELAEYMVWCGNSNGRPERVGTRLANRWGLEDMHGNVWEWCADSYESRYPGGRVTDPTGATTGPYRVYRGGGWNNYPRDCRSADRSRRSPFLTDGNLGFRVALVPVP